MGFLTRTSILLATLMVFVGLSACDNHSSTEKAPAITAAEAIVISNPRIRATAPGQKVSGAFMTLTNTSAKPFALTSASFDAAKTVEIHETSMSGKVMRMMQVDQIDVPASGGVELKPGSYHIMLMGLGTDLKAGTTKALTLTFSDNSQTTIEAEVSDLNN